MSDLERYASVASERVEITRDGEWFVVSDEGGEFARATLIADALRYASDLLHGPGTGPRGSVWNLMKAMESGEPWHGLTQHTRETDSATPPRKDATNG